MAYIAPVRNRTTRQKEGRLDTRQIEALTAAYLRGELSLAQFQEKLRRIDARVDLRKLASGLKVP